jgi:hypothetical protein
MLARVSVLTAALINIQFFWDVMPAFLKGNTPLILRNNQSKTGVYLGYGEWCGSPRQKSPKGSKQQNGHFN